MGGRGPLSPRRASTSRATLVARPAGLRGRTCRGHGMPADEWPASSFLSALAPGPWRQAWQGDIAALPLAGLQVCGWGGGGGGGATLLPRGFREGVDNGWWHYRLRQLLPSSAATASCCQCRAGWAPRVHPHSTGEVGGAHSVPEGRPTLMGMGIVQAVLGLPSRSLRTGKAPGWSTAPLLRPGFVSLVAMPGGAGMCGPEVRALGVSRGGAALPPAVSQGCPPPGGREEGGGCRRRLEEGRRERKVLAMEARTNKFYARRRQRRGEEGGGGGGGE